MCCPYFVYIRGVCSFRRFLVICRFLYDCCMSPGTCVLLFMQRQAREGERRCAACPVDETTWLLLLLLLLIIILIITIVVPDLAGSLVTEGDMIGPHRDR